MIFSQVAIGMMTLDSCETVITISPRKRIIKSAPKTRKTTGFRQIKSPAGSADGAHHTLQLQHCIPQQVRQLRIMGCNDEGLSGGFPLQEEILQELLGLGIEAGEGLVQD